MSENPAITYVVPDDGGAIWTDNFAIPKQLAILKELMRLSISCCVLKTPLKTLSMSVMRHRVRPREATATD